MKIIKSERPELFEMKTKTKRKYPNEFIIYAYNNKIFELNKPEQIFGTWNRNSGRVIGKFSTYADVIEVFRPESKSINMNGVFSNFLYKHGIDISFPELLNLQTRQAFYDILNPRKCIICDSFFPRTANQAFGNSLKTCSADCKSTISSKTMANTNKNRSQELREQAAKKQSVTMKKKIADGSFTPCVTNSWARSRVKVGGLPFRSSWEALFWIINQNLEYETLRIPYIFNGTTHNYILDFVDRENRIIYEIKPDGNLDDEKVKCKEKHAKLWAEENDYEFKFISSKYFKENIKEIEILYNNMFQGIDYRSCRLMMQSIKIFKGSTWHELNQ